MRSIGLLLAGLLLASGCSKVEKALSGSEEAGTPKPGVAGKGVEDFAGVNESTTPEEKRFLEAGRPFVVALAARQYDRAYDCLSSHACAKMSLNQFDAPSDEAQLKANQENPMTDVTAEQFAAQMKKLEERFGPPSKPSSLSVQSADPRILSGQVGEPLEKLDVMFAIGMMPDSIPHEIRKASLRAQIDTKWDPEDLRKAAQEMETTEAEALQELESPYFTVKFVLVEEAGQLKVGYFEFMPPSMLD
jgi:hypothetical protein